MIVLVVVAAFGLQGVASDPQSRSSDVAFVGGAPAVEEVPVPEEVPAVVEVPAATADVVEVSEENADDLDDELDKGVKGVPSWFKKVERNMKRAFDKKEARFEKQLVAGRSSSSDEDRDEDLISEGARSSDSPTTSKRDPKSGTPVFVLTVQSAAIGVFLGGLILHVYGRWSLAVLCFTAAFCLDILTTHTANWTGRGSNFTYQCYRTFALLSFRCALIYLVIGRLRLRNKFAVALGAWNFLDICATTLMFMACDLLNNMSYESSGAQYLSPLKWVYSNNEAQFAIEYGTMLFLVAAYELYGNNRAGSVADEEYDPVGADFARQGAGGARQKLRGVLLAVVGVSSLLFLWAGVNNAMMLAQGVGFFAGPWKNNVCHTA